MLGLMLALTVPLVAMTGACPAGRIALAGIRSTHTDGDVRDIDVAITVVNHTAQAQPASYLQSVEIWQDGTKVDQKGVPPLKPGASATVTYQVQRSAGGRSDSTNLRLQLVGHDPHDAGCSNAGEPYRLSV
jgi:hypothetical protein